IKSVNLSTGSEMLFETIPTNGFTYLPEYTCPPAPWKSAATSAGGGERYSMECAHHGWHHEPHSPVKNTMCKRWDTPKKTLTAPLRACVRLGTPLEPRGGGPLLWLARILHARIECL